MNRVIFDIKLNNSSEHKPIRQMKFGKKLLAIAIINFCWSAYRVIDYSLSFDEYHETPDASKRIHVTKCSLGLCMNTITIIVVSLLCYAAFYEDALESKGRLYLLPYMVWQPFVIAFEIGIMVYLLMKKVDDILEDITIYSIGIILLVCLYFAVCLQFAYFRNVSIDNEKKLRNFATTSQESTKESSAYTSFKDVLPTY